MGLIAKSRTKKRIAPEQGPAHESLAGSPWLTTGGLTMGELVRSAVMSLELGGATSNTVRGRTSFVGGAVAAALTGAASSLWVETTDFQEWSLVLGVMTLKGTIAADWAVQVAVDPPAASITTRQALTNDDELVNGEPHDALRRALMDTLAAGELAGPDAEAAVTEGSMTTLRQPFPSPPPEPCAVTFTIETSRLEDAKRQALDSMGARLVETTPTSLTWAVGLPASADQLTLTLTPTGVSGCAQIVTRSPAGRRIAAQGLRSLIARTVFLLRLDGQTAHYQGPSEWEPSK